jgi:predicted nucleic acid-binding protein
MSYEYVIDSYAWVEYFRGTPSGERARPYIESDRSATSALTLAELREKYLREGWRSYREDSEFIGGKTFVAPLDRQAAELAGELNHERKKEVAGWGMADSVVLATAKMASARVVTGDKHFKGLPDAILI